LLSASPSRPPPPHLSVEPSHLYLEQERSRAGPRLEGSEDLAYHSPVCSQFGEELSQELE